MNRKYTLRGFLVILFSCGFVMPSVADPIVLTFSSRPPYYVLETSGAVTGIVATPAAQVFEAAGVDFRWAEVSFNRQLKDIKDNRKQVCAVGWFKNPEREKFAKFTEYIYQNKPLIVLGRADNDAVAAHQTLRALMNDRSLKMGKKLGYSYGPTADGLANELKPSSVTTTQDNTGMTRMLVGRRFDYFVSSPEEGEHLIESLGIASKDVVMIEFKDLPPGSKRYILCSQSVGDEIIKRLNAVIRDTLR